MSCVLGANCCRCFSVRMWSNVLMRSCITNCCKKLSSYSRGYGRGYNANVSYCCAVLSSTFRWLIALFQSELRTYLTFSDNHFSACSTIVCWTDLMALDLLLDFFAQHFYVLVPFFSVLVISHVRQTKLASSLSTFNARWYTDQLIDWYCRCVLLCGPSFSGKPCIE